MTSQRHMRLALTSSLTVIGLLASGCANQTTSYRTQRVGGDGPMIVTVDAQLRHLIMAPETGSGRANQWRTCSEAAPDVFSAMSASAAAEGSYTSDGTQRAARLRGALAIAQTAATIERTQTINLLRESLFRTCERFLSGGMDRAALAVQAGRDLRAMVAVLAIEQLTRTTRPPSTVISAGPTSVDVSSTEEARRQLEAAQRQLRDAQAEKEEAQALTCPAATTTTPTPTTTPASGTTPTTPTPTSPTTPLTTPGTTTPATSGTTPTPDTTPAGTTAPAMTPTTTTPATMPATTPVCDSKQAAIDAADDKVRGAQAEVDRWQTVVNSGVGDSIAAETGAGTVNAGGGGSVPSEGSVRYVATIVGDIVRRAFDVDETQLFCLQLVQDANIPYALKQECLRYLLDKVQAERGNLFRTAASQDLRARLSLAIQVGRAALTAYIGDLADAAYEAERSAIAQLLPSRRFCVNRSRQQCIDAIYAGEIDIDAHRIPEIISQREQARRQQ